MSFFAIVTVDDGRLVAGSSIAISDESGDIVAAGEVPDRVEHAGVLAPARICAAIRNLGFQPARGDYYGSLTQRGNTVKVDVEPLS